MDDTTCRAFFSRPTNPYHRRYEALRAVFLDGRAAKDVAEQFGLTHRSLQQVVYEFRQHCRNPAAASPFFASAKTAGLRCGRRRRRLLRKRSLPSPIVGSSSSRQRPSRCG